MGRRRAEGAADSVLGPASLKIKTKKKKRPPNPPSLRSYFTDLDAARAPAPTITPPFPPPPEAWSPAVDAEGVTPASLAESVLTRPTDDDDVSGALAAILSVGSAPRPSGSGVYDVAEALAAAATGDI